MKLETATPEMAVAFVAAEDVRRTATGRLAEFLAGRLAAARALRTLTDATRPVIRRSADGRPTARVNDQWVELSISHLDGYAASVATMSGCAVGIDLVRVNSVQPHERRFFLSACEQCQTRACDPTVLWALKEAAWKAIRATRDVPFKDVQLEFSGKGRVSAVHCDGETRRAGSMILAPWPDYRAAVVWVADSIRTGSERAEAA